MKHLLALITLLFSSINFLYGQVGDISTESNCYTGNCIMEETKLCKGSTYAYNFHTENYGSGDLYGKVGLFFSKDSVYDSGDTYVLSYEYTHLTAGEWKNSTGNVIINVPVGDWNVILVSDYDDENNETDESNNIIVNSVRVTEQLPDLVVGNSGDTITEIRGTESRYFNNLLINNEGCIGHGDFSVKFYHSLDSFVSQDDYLGETYDWKLGGISPGFSGQIITTSNYQTGGVPLGISYLIIVVDADSLYQESDEENNYKIYTINGINDSVDYELRSFQLDSNTYSELDSIHCTIEWTRYLNNANQYSNCWMGLFLSEDSLWDEGDLIITEDFEPNTILGLTSIYEVNERIPAVEGGEYYLLAVADNRDQAKEANEINNVKFEKITISNLCGSILDLTADTVVMCEYEDYQIADNWQAYRHKVYFEDTLYLFLTSSPVFRNDGSTIIDTLNSTSYTDTREGNFTANFSNYPDTMYSFGITGKLDANGKLDTNSSCYRVTTGPTFFGAKNKDVLVDKSVFCKYDTLKLWVDNDEGWTNKRWYQSSTFYYDDTLKTQKLGWVSIYYTDSNNCDFFDETYVFPKKVTATIKDFDSNCGDSTGIARIRITTGDSIFWNMPANTKFIDDSSYYVPNLDTGVHSFIIRDTLGCFKELTTTIESDSFYIELQQDRSIPCYGSNVAKISVSSYGYNYPISYEWMDDLNENSYYRSNLSAGMYIVKMSDLGCSKIDTIIITQPEPDVILIDSSIAIGDSLVKWGETYFTTGVYRDTLVTSECDSVIEINLTVSSITNSSALEFEKVQLYPNPNSGIFQIQHNQKEGFIRIFNSVGLKIFQSEITKKVEWINVNYLPRGIYMVEIGDGLSKVRYSKLIIR